MSVCQNPINYRQLTQGKKYNVYEGDRDTLVFSGWYSGNTQGRSAQMWMVFRLDKADPIVEDPELERGWMYGVFSKADEDGEYKLIRGWTVVPPHEDEGSTYRYCLVEEGGRRKARRKHTRRRKGKGRSRRSTAK